nr:hypothetical protein CFP56_58163 [Quercus suber]
MSLTGYLASPGSVSRKAAICVDPKSSAYPRISLDCILDLWQWGLQLLDRLTVHNIYRIQYFGRLYLVRRWHMNSRRVEVSGLLKEMGGFALCKSSSKTRSPLDGTVKNMGESRLRHITGLSMDYLYRLNSIKYFYDDIEAAESAQVLDSTTETPNRSEKRPDNPRICIDASGVLLVVLGCTTERLPGPTTSRHCESALHLLLVRRLRLLPKLGQHMPVRKAPFGRNLEIVCQLLETFTPFNARALPSSTLILHKDYPWDLAWKGANEADSPVQVRPEHVRQIAYLILDTKIVVRCEVGDEQVKPEVNDVVFEGVWVLDSLIVESRNLLGHILADVSTSKISVAMKWRCTYLYDIKRSRA